MFAPKRARSGTPAAGVRRHQARAVGINHRGHPPILPIPAHDQRASPPCSSPIANHSSTDWQAAHSAACSVVGPGWRHCGMTHAKAGARSGAGRCQGSESEPRSSAAVGSRRAPSAVRPRAPYSPYDPYYERARVLRGLGLLLGVAQGEQAVAEAGGALSRQELQRQPKDCHSSSELHGTLCDPSPVLLAWALGGRPTPTGTGQGRSRSRGKAVHTGYGLADAYPVLAQVGFTGAPARHVCGPYSASYVRSTPGTAPADEETAHVHVGTKPTLHPPSPTPQALLAAMVSPVGGRQPAPAPTPSASLASPGLQYTARQGQGQAKAQAHAQSQGPLSPLCSPGLLFCPQLQSRRRRDPQTMVQA